MADTALDDQIRRFVYDHMVEHGVAPSTAELSERLAKPAVEIKEALLRLSEGHAVMAQPESCDLWRAAPFSAVPTAFEVRAGKKRWWANCIWDGLGILAALHQDGEVLTCCPCCNQAMALTVKDGKLQAAEGAIYFQLPVRDWYKDIVFT
jgi:alkylmercury lyase-like protein